jgi:hypothetical protein
MNLESLELQIERRWVDLTRLPEDAQVPLYLHERLVLDEGNGDPVRVWILLDVMREGSRRVGGPGRLWNRSATLPGLRDAVYETLNRMRPG